MKYILIFLLSVVFSTSTSAVTCQYVRPRINITMKPGNVSYVTHLTRQQFLRAAPIPASPNSIGLTVAQLNILGGAKPSIEQKGGATACVGLEEMNLTVGYETLKVYIDKKYRPGTCEYNVVKEHENYHVAVSQQAMRFFEKDIRKALEKATLNIKPKPVNSQIELDDVFNRQFQQIMNEMQPLLNHINKKIAEKNYVIDTPESYAATLKLCKNW